MMEFLTVTLIITLAAISPGPDFAMVVQNTVMGGRRAGVLTAAGVASSLVVHSILAILGLALVLSQSETAFHLIRYLGAGYLIYLGIRSVFVSASRPEQKIGAKQSVTRAYLRGLLCNLLNPKAVLFLIAFFSLVIQPSSSYFIQMGYGFEIALIHLIWFSGLAILISHRRIHAWVNRSQIYITKAMGLAFIGFGTKIAFFM